MGIYIPGEVIRHSAMSWTDRVIVSDILFFQQRGMSYYKSNATIADELRMSERNVSRSISQLVTMGILRCEFNGRKRECTVTLDVSQIGEDSQNVYGSQDGESASPKRRGRVAKLARQSRQIGERIVLHSNNSEVVLIEKKDMPFVSDAFLNAWEEWLAERKEKKIRKYTKRGAKAALTNLKKISGDDEAKAIQIINQSIENGWQGFWPIKANKPKGFNAGNFSIEGLHDFVDVG